MRVQAHPKNVTHHGLIEQLLRPLRPDAALEVLASTDPLEVRLASGWSSEGSGRWQVLGFGTNLLAAAVFLVGRRSWRGNLLFSRSSASSDSFDFCLTVSKGGVASREPEERSALQPCFLGPFFVGHSTEKWSGLPQCSQMCWRPLGHSLSSTAFLQQGPSFRRPHE